VKGCISVCTAGKHIKQEQKQLNEQTKQRGLAAEEAERGEPRGKGAGIKTARFSLSVDWRRVEVGNSFYTSFLCFIYEIY
jgi:hypothetical protein